VKFAGNSLNLNSYTEYILRPEVALQTLRGDLPTYKELGVNGVVLDGQFSDLLQSDFRKGGVTDRGQSLKLQTQMLHDINESLGMSGYSRASVFAAGRADMLYGFPISPAYEVFNGKTVPFYPIAVHGLSAYVAKEANLVVDEGTDLLRAIEYGALPFYTVTHDPTSELKYTSDRWWLTSSRFDSWKDTIVRQYMQYKERLGSTSHLFISDHRQLAEQVFVTVYEDGRQVVVNYSDRPYRYGGVEVGAHDYAVVTGNQPTSGSGEGN
jgi:hypothetical protein